MDLRFYPRSSSVIISYHLACDCFLSTHSHCQDKWNKKVGWLSQTAIWLLTLSSFRNALNSLHASTNLYWVRSMHSLFAADVFPVISGTPRPVHRVGWSFDSHSRGDGEIPIPNQPQGRTNQTPVYSLASLVKGCIGHPVCSNQSEALMKWGFIYWSPVGYVTFRSSWNLVDQVIWSEALRMVPG